MIVRQKIRLLAVAALMFFAATAGADPQISKLPSGPHLGVMVGFEPLFERTERADELVQMAIDAGMSIGRAQVDWADLEIANGVYDAEELNDRLEIAGRGGLYVFVTFSSIDTSELTLPAYLSDENGAAFDGHLLSDAEIRVPYLAFLDWFVPELAKHNVWGLALGNEVDTPSGII